MKGLGNLLTCFALIAFAFACTKEGEFQNDEYSTDNEHIKSSSNCLSKQVYLYDISGRIKEKQGTYSYERYLYDKNDRLEKVESAWDMSSISSSSFLPGQKNGLMTSANVTINLYSSYKYDKVGRLSKIENYFIQNGKNFELTSIKSFEYEGALICRENLCDEKGQIMQFYDYSYDENGNITKEKYYVCMYTGLSNPELNYETTYKYDNYKNPFQILNILGPKFYTGSNNMIEMTTKWYSSNPRTEISKQTFKYNAKGYPVKMTYDGGVEEYTY